MPAMAWRIVLSQAPLIATFFNRQSNPNLLQDVYRFRYALFIEELGWSLPASEGREIDSFDTGDATYCSLSIADRIVGCFRAIPCDKPYLARTVFPYMASQLNYPTSSLQIEISRLGVRESARHLSPVLYSLMLRYGMAAGVSALVALTDLVHERLLQKMRIRTIRYGDTQIVGFRHDGSWLLGVAGEIPLSDPCQNFSPIIQLSRSVEIRDEASVFRRELLSA